MRSCAAGHPSQTNARDLLNLLSVQPALLPPDPDPACRPALPVMDLERVGVPLLVLTAAAAVTRRWWLPRLQAWQRRRRLKHHTGLDRDLNV